MTFSDGDFNEANVRNAIEYVPYNRVLGVKLAIPPGKLNIIDGLAPSKQKQKLVETLFRVNPDCNWTMLKAAIKAADVSEWTNRLRSSWKKSCSGSLSEDFSTSTHFDVSSGFLIPGKSCL